MSSFSLNNPPLGYFDHLKPILNSDEQKEYLEYFWNNPDFHPEHLTKITRPEIENLFMDKGVSKDEKELLKNHRTFFIRILHKNKQFKDNPLWGKYRYGTEPFERSSRSFLKTIQEIFSHEDETMIIPQPIDQKKTIDFLIFDPQKISDNDLKIFGLEEYIAKKGSSKEEKLQKKAEAIPQIKEILKTLEPLNEREKSDHYFRLTRMTEGNNKGYLLGTRHIKGGEKIFFKTGIHEADRSLQYIHEGYSTELEKLNTILSHLDTIYKTLEDWKGIKQQQEKEGVKDFSETKVYQEMRSYLFSCIFKLQFVSNSNKQQLKSRLLRILPLKVKVNGMYRNNPVAIQGTLGGAKNDIQKRKDEIFGISKHIGEDRARVIDIVSQEGMPMRNFLTKVENIQNDSAILHPKKKMDEKKRNDLLLNMDMGIKSLENLKFQPYITFGEKFREQIQNTQEALKNNEREKAAKEFIKTYLVTKIVHTYDIMQDWLSIDFQDTSINFSKNLLETVHHEFDLLLERKVTPEIMTDEYNKAFENIARLFDEINFIIEQFYYASPHVYTEKKEYLKKYKYKLLEEMKECIKKFDFTKLVKELP